MTLLASCGEGDVVTILVMPYTDEEYKELSKLGIRYGKTFTVDSVILNGSVSLKDTKGNYIIITYSLAMKIEVSRRRSRGSNLWS
jgi:Fe2+ transport system protein FeoA